MLRIIKHNSASEELANANAAMHQSNNRLERRNPIKSLDIAQEIIKDVLVRDLERPPHLSQTFAMLEAFPDTESVFHYQVIS